jgi:phosphoribosylanthranilate isomerase
MKLKVCGLKDRENILQVVEHKPDYIGFIFYPKSPRYAGKELNADFTQSISSAKKVGVFVNESEINILDKVSRFGLDYVQLHGNETPEFCKQVQQYVPVIKAFGISGTFNFSSLDAYKDACDYFLFDSSSKEYGGSGKTFNWDKLKEYTLQKLFFLSGGIDLQNIDEIQNLTIPQLMAVDVNSCFEIKPGMKDISKIKELTTKIKMHVVSR